MKKTYIMIIISVLTSLYSFAQPVDLSKTKAEAWRGKGNTECTVNEAGEITVKAVGDEEVLKNGKVERQYMVSYGEVLIEGVPSEANAIRFEAKGSSINNGKMMSVFLSHAKSYAGYEASFYPNSDGWEEVIVPLNNFTQTFIPHDNDFASVYIKDKEKLRRIAFGRGRGYHRHQLGEWEISIRNVSFISGIEERKAPEVYSKYLSKTTSLIREGKPLNILMLGDSITESGRTKTYAHHMAKKIKERYGVNCSIANAAIGGHSTRYGRLVFPRSIKKMPKPDLVTIFYGANDCAFTRYGMTAENFQRQLESLIDTVRAATDGQADIMLFSGVLRLNKERTKTNGAVEPILPGIKSAAENRETAYCDTLSNIDALEHEQKLTVYKDTIHPTEYGHEFMGEILYNTVEKYLKKD